MAKQTLPGFKTGGSALPKVIVAVVGLALLVVVVKHPADAATFAKSAVAGIGAVADGIATFIGQLSA